jgi:hypothetical protein
MNDTIKLSKDFKKAISILRQLEELTKEFKDVFDELDNDEKNLVGGLVIGIYSPIKDGPGMDATIGNTIYCQGLLGKLGSYYRGEKREDSLLGLLDLLGRRSNDN